MGKKGKVSFLPLPPLSFFGSRFISRAAKTENPIPRSFFNPFTARVDDGVCEVVLTFTSVDKILWCDHSNEISLEVLSCGVICFKKIYKMEFGIFVEFAVGHIWQ